MSFLNIRNSTHSETKPNDNSPFLKLILNKTTPPNNFLMTTWTIVTTLFQRNCSLNFKEMCSFNGNIHPGAKVC